MTGDDASVFIGFGLAAAALGFAITHARRQSARPRTGTDVPSDNSGSYDAGSGNDSCSGSDGGGGCD